MYTVTQRIKSIKQPTGGHVKPKDFIITQLEDEEILVEKESIHASLVGMAVDYLTRMTIGTDKIEAFKISLLGARAINQLDNATFLLTHIDDLSDRSIERACKLVGYDVINRSGRAGFKPIKDITPDSNTINNVRIMVKRSIKFFETYGPIVKDGFNFEGGYTDIISHGDGDFISEDTLWDFKVSKNRPTTKQTLQLLIYFLMGQQSIHPEFQSIKKIGIFNPRLNKVYLQEISAINLKDIEIVKNEIIGYK